MSKMLADYVYEESDELVLKLQQQVLRDGFDAEESVEAVMVQILSQAMVKVLAIVAEGSGDRSLGEAYVELLPLHYAMVSGYEEKLKGGCRE